jgi:D-tagatose-bisphosphate aldolase class II non-catalytic subunit
MSVLRELGAGRGITSVCSAHPLVIEAALLEAHETSQPALIEATCNQVNQDGGYTGMTPDDFRNLVFRIADSIGVDRKIIIFGGDHLGPNPWKHLPAAEAMAKAEVMVRDYVCAGFTKIHLDCSMACADDGLAPPESEIADRAARLCAVAEKEGQPVYVIGTEVPTPGGAVGEMHELAVTKPADVEETLRLHREAFERHGVGSAFERVIAVVTQPGVEFGHDAVVQYDHAKARDLTAMLARHPGLVFEAHSTDYQTADELRQLVEDGFAILKVGPWLTFALREALYAADPSLEALLEQAMLDDPRYWAPYYQGTPEEQRHLRHESFSDRIRYYWGVPKVRAAVDALLADRAARTRVIDAVRGVLKLYSAASRPRG